MSALLDALSSAPGNFMNGLKVLGNRDTYATAADDFQRGLGVLGNTYQDQGLGGAAGQLYGGANQAFRTGAGLGDQSTFDALRNLGVPRVPAAFAGSATDTLANPAMIMAPAALGLAAGAVSPLAKAISSPAARRFLANESGAVNIGGPAHDWGEDELFKIQNWMIKTMRNSRSTGKDLSAKEQEMADALQAFQEEGNDQSLNESPLGKLWNQFPEGNKQ